MLESTIMGALASVLIFWLGQSVVGRGLATGLSLLSISSIVALVSGVFLLLFGLTLGSVDAHRSTPVRRLVLASGYALVPFLATVLLFREQGDSWSYLWSSWAAILESLPWFVAYLGGAFVLLITQPRAPSPQLESR